MNSHNVIIAIFLIYVCYIQLIEYVDGYAVYKACNVVHFMYPICDHGVFYHTEHHDNFLLNLSFKEIMLPDCSNVF